MADRALMLPEELWERLTAAAALREVTVEALAAKWLDAALFASDAAEAMARRSAARRQTR